MDYTVARTFSSLYIILDIIWLLVFIGALLYFSRHMAVIVGLLAGFVYFLVDYGIFYQVLGTRQINGAAPVWFLFWLSMSYGFTNFAWIWLLLNGDSHAVEWSFFPILGWITIGQLSHNFGAGFPEITISRGTGTYHGVMALILCVGYLYIIFNNLSGKGRVNILRLMAIGIGVQFAWETSLLISGIRPPLWQPIVVNSLIETNLGMPYIYYIHQVITKRREKALSLNMVNKFAE
ncbi:MAG: hypothetical protein K0B06_12560 [Brevefilum sp.]|nr:hypothetical protein [Brevefilum sp.]